MMYSVFLVVKDDVLGVVTAEDDLLGAHHDLLDLLSQGWKCLVDRKYIFTLATISLSCSTMYPHSRSALCPVRLSARSLQLPYNNTEYMGGAGIILLLWKLVYGGWCKNHQHIVLYWHWEEF